MASGRPNRRGRARIRLLQWGETAMRKIIGALTTCAVLVVAGCTANTNRQAPELESNLTYDGLAKVKNSRASAAWMRPDFTLEGYTKVMLLGAGIEYRPVKPVPRAAASTAKE